MGEGGSHPADPKQTPNSLSVQNLGDRSRAIMCGCERVRTQTVV